MTIDYDAIDYDTIDYAIDYDTISYGLARIVDYRHRMANLVIERNEVIQDLRANGATINDLARAAGLTPDAVREIASAKKP